MQQLLSQSSSHTHQDTNEGNDETQMTATALLTLHNMNSSPSRGPEWSGGTLSHEEQDEHLPSSSFEEGEEQMPSGQSLRSTNGGDSGPLPEVPRFEEEEHVTEEE